jgi:glutathione synthase/RimK-type ligase-like ATP-grasp enzyme
MPRILFLLGDIAQARNDNHQRLPEAFRAAGWDVLELPHDSAHIYAGRLNFAAHGADRFDLVWPLGFGPSGSFFDRMQLLDLLPPSRLVNDPRALTFLHGKYRWLEQMPETHADNDLEALIRVVAGGGDWVIKPTAGSYGRGVILIRAGEDPRHHLQRLIYPQPESAPQYCIVQRYLPEIVDGETRTLVAGGAIVGSYLRLPADGLRANLEAGATTTGVDLSAAQVSQAQRLAAELATNGIRFAAIDRVGDRLLEVNVANPGGLATLEALYGKDLSSKVVRCIVATTTGVPPQP